MMIMKTDQTYSHAAMGRNLQHLRLSAGLTQQDVAHYVGVSYQQIQKYEKGKNCPNAELIYRLGCLYDVPCLAFFRGMNPLGDSRLSQTVAGSDDLTQKIILRIARIGDGRTKRKISRMISVLTEEE